MSIMGVLEPSPTTSKGAHQWDTGSDAQLGLKPSIQCGMRMSLATLIAISSTHHSKFYKKLYNLNLPTLFSLQKL